MSRKQLTKRYHELLSKRQGGDLCWYCGIPLQGYTYGMVNPRSIVSRNSMVADHLLPTSRGGNDDVDNLVLSCFSCNSEKRDMTLDEYRLSKQVYTLPPHLFWFEREKGK